MTMKPTSLKAGLSLLVLMVLNGALEGAVFKEVNGQAVIEAVHWDARAPEASGPHHWGIVPDEEPWYVPPADLYEFARSRSGRYMQVLPDDGSNRTSADPASGDYLDAGPHLDYRIQVATAGTYQLYLRTCGANDSSDSLYAEILELRRSVGGPGPDWYRVVPNPHQGDFGLVFDNSDQPGPTTGWEGHGTPEVTNSGNSGDRVPVLWAIANPGIYTLRLLQREDGNAVDALVFQLENLAPPDGLGPAESPCAGPCLFINQQPVRAIVGPGQTATFSVGVNASEPLAYQWQATVPGGDEFYDVPGATSVTYVTPAVTAQDDSTAYRCLVRAGDLTEISGAVLLLIDHVPPEVTGVASAPTLDTVTVSFSEPLDRALATQAGNYAIGGLTVSAAVLSDDGRELVLQTSPQATQARYTLTMWDLRDRVGNVLAPNPMRIDFSGWVFQDWYVAPDGVDGPGRGTPAAPFKTLIAALEAAQSGDTIHVRQGIYRESEMVRIRHGRVTIEAPPGERATIHAPTDDEDNFATCLWFDPSASDCTLRRLEIIGGYYYGIMFQTKWDWGDPNDRSGASRVRVEDCLIHDTGRDAIKVTPGCDDIVVRRCEIYRSGVGPAGVASQNAEGVDNVNGDRMLVEDCYIHDTLSTGIYIKGGSIGSVVQRTRVERCGGAGILLGFDTSPEYFDLTVNPRYYENIDGIVRDCLVRETHYSGIGLFAATNALVSNNTVLNAALSGSHSPLYFGLTYQDWAPEAGRPPSVQARLLNNIVWQRQDLTAPMVSIRYSADMGGMSAYEGRPVMDGNCYLQEGGQARFSDRRPTSELEGASLAGWAAHIQNEARSLEADPKFAHAASGDFRLTAASPCIDRGILLPPMTGETDLRGMPRVFGAGLDLGAYEAVLRAVQTQFLPTESLLRVVWEAPPGAVCQAESTTTLGPSHWLDLGEPASVPSDGTLTVDALLQGEFKACRLRWDR